MLIEGTPVGFDAMATPVEAGPCRLLLGVSDGVGPHDDYLPEFPFLGAPNEQASGSRATLLASDTSA